MWNGGAKQEKKRLAGSKGGGVGGGGGFEDGMQMLTTSPLPNKNFVAGVGVLTCLL